MLIVRKPWLVLLIYSILILLSCLFIPNLKVEYNFRDFFSDGDPELAFYQEFTGNFGTDEQMLMIAVQNRGSVFERSFLRQFDAFTRDCSQLPLVEKAYSLTTLKDHIRTPLGFSRIPFMHIGDTARYEADSLRIFSDPRMPGWLISKDGLALSAVLRIQEKTNEKERDRLINSIDSLIGAYSFRDVHMAGYINTESRFVREIREEIRFNIILCSIVIFICFFLFFRSLTRVLCANACLLTAMIIFYGLLGLFHRPINVLSTMFPTIIMVVGTSGLIHIFTFYHREIHATPDKRKAMAITVKELAIRILMTSLTTAVGFFSLITSSMKPIRNFGIEAGIGVMLTFVVAITLFPAILSLLKLSKTLRIQTASEKGWPRLLNGIQAIVENRPNLIIAVTILLSVASVFGIMNIDKNNFILGNYSVRSEISRDVAFFEEKFSGIRILSMAVIPGKDGQMNDIDVLRETEKMQDYLQNLPAVGILFSPVTIYKTFNKISNGGMPEYFTLPSSQEEIDEFDKTFAGALREQDFRFTSDDRKMGLITGMMKDVGSEKARQMEEQIENWTRENIDGSTVGFRLTGFYYLSDRSNDYVIRNMMYNLALAFFIVSFLMLSLFRNLKMLFISLIPNIVPIIFGGLMLYISGIVLNAYVAIVFTIAFVIAVDNTIHYLAKYRIQRSLGQSGRVAREETLKSTGKAMIMTTLVLFFGFLVLIHSDIKGVHAQGLLISSMLIVALLADLFLLPVLLKKMHMT